LPAVHWASMTPSSPRTLWNTSTSTVQSLLPWRNRVNLCTQPKVECHTEASTITCNLHHLLQFGSILDQQDFDDLVDNHFEDIVKTCSEQLLFWHISGEVNTYNEPVDHILVWSNTDYFWFVLIPQSTREIHCFLKGGDWVYFLEWFSLNHIKFELTFSELRRLSSPSEETLVWPLVVTLSKEYTYHWNTSLWEVTLNNPDHWINNPTHYTLPLRTLGTQPLFESNYDSERKNIASSLHELTNWNHYIRVVYPSSSSLIPVTCPPSNQLVHPSRVYL